MNTTALLDQESIMDTANVPNIYSVVSIMSFDDGRADQVALYPSHDGSEEAAQSLLTAILENWINDHDVTHAADNSVIVDCGTFALTYKVLAFAPIPF